MKNHTSRKIKLLALMMSGVTFLMITVLPPLSLAQDFRPKGYARAFYPRPGARVKALPAGHRSVHVGPAAYFFLDGIFYSHFSHGYMVAAAPIGAVVPLLPPAAALITIGALTYYTFADVYYQKVRDGYMVVPQPAKPAQPDEAMAWEGDQVQVSVPVLNVRSGPGTGHQVIEQVEQGDILVVQSTSSDWYYVKLPDQSMGWVMVKFTALVRPKAVG